MAIECLSDLRWHYYATRTNDKGDLVLDYDGIMAFCQGFIGVDAQSDLILFAKYAASVRFSMADVERIFAMVAALELHYFNEPIDRYSGERLDFSGHLALIIDRIEAKRRANKWELEALTRVVDGRYWARGEIRLASDPHQLSPQAKSLKRYKFAFPVAAFWCLRHDVLAAMHK